MIALFVMFVHRVAKSWAFINAKTADVTAFGARKGEPFANGEFLRVLFALFADRLQRR